MNETTPRQILYALVAGGFVLVVTVLTVGGAAAGIVPTWWSAIMALAVMLAGTWIGSNWKRTGSTLGVAIGLFLLWMVGTLLAA